MTITADLHSHTAHSHARHTVREMADSAASRGLRIFGISEHSLRPEGYAYPSDYQEKLRKGFETYADEVLAERDRYRGRMDVLLALEMDYMPAEEAYARECVGAHDYDYVIGGLHFLGPWGFDFAAEDWSSLTDGECHAHFEHYYGDLGRMASSGLFQIAAHPDLVKLFRKDTFARWVDTPRATECIRAALEAVRDAGMAMEVSSAAIRKGLGEPYPGPALMALARDLNLPVSFGSDAHNVADVASHFDTLAGYARSFGYTSSAVFRAKTMSLVPFA